MNQKVYDFFTNSDYEVYLIEYRGDFSQEIQKVSYAYGSKLTDTLGIVAVKSNDIEKLYKDVPSIEFANFNQLFVLESDVVGYTPQSTSNIASIKTTPYLNLSGSGVLIGIIDTGIDYLNQEFTREDGTTRIESLWDQTIPSKTNFYDSSPVFIGSVYSRDQINEALKAKEYGKNPYDIVPSVDEIGHGTQLAGITGARGFNKQIEGVANDCNFVIVKLIQSAFFKARLKENNINNVPVYNSGEILAALEYLRQYALQVKKPISILFSLGSTDYTHDGNTTLSRYINDLGAYNGISIVSGTGNQGAAEGHASGNIANFGDIKTTELLISQPQKTFSFKIFVRRPNKLTLNLISPSGQSSGFIPAKLNQQKKVRYILEDTSTYIRYFTPDNITGLQIIALYFEDIKPGIWKLQLKGDYVIDGRYDMWLPPYNTIPEGTKFLNPDPFITLTNTACTKKAVSVAFYNQINNSIVSESGKGFPFNNYTKPDIAAPGVNIITTSINNTTKIISGSSVASAIVAGCCALLLQWGIVNGNNVTMYSPTLISYLISGATRAKDTLYPNADWGYGTLDLVGVFNWLSGITSSRLYPKKDESEYQFRNLFIRHPK